MPRRFDEYLFEKIYEEGKRKGEIKKAREIAKKYGIELAVKVTGLSKQEILYTFE